MSSFLLRPATDGDADAVVELVSALDVALLGSTDYSLDDLHDEWRDIAPEDRFLVEDDGTVVGYGTIELNPQHGQSDGYVHPAHFGRGVGSFVVRELEQRLAERGVTRVQNAALVLDPRAHELLRAQGYKEIRRFWHMRIELEQEPPAPQWPDGLSVSQVRSRRRGRVPRGVRSRVRRPLAARAAVLRGLAAEQHRPRRLLARALGGRARRRPDRRRHDPPARAPGSGLARPALHAA